MISDDDEPEHLHDPPFLKYIPHLWPGGGECGDRTEPGIFYDGNDLAWRNGVLSTLNSVPLLGVIVSSSGVLMGR